jgi:tetratricopeptide (TPR) repeat protein
MDNLAIQIKGQILHLRNLYQRVNKACLRPRNSLIMVLFLLFAAGDMAQAAEKSAVAEAQKTEQKQAKPKVKAEKSYQSGFAGSYLSGRFAKDQQDLDKASQYLEKSLNKTEDETRFVLDAMRAHVLAGNIRKAQKLLKRLSKQADIEPMVAILSVVTHVENKRYDAALAILEKTSERGLLGIIKPAMTGWVFMGKQHGKAPVFALDDAIAKSGFFAPFLHYQQGLMFALAGNNIQARFHLEQAISNPQTAPYRIADMLVKLYLRLGETQKAAKIVSEFNHANADAVFLLTLPDENAKAAIAPEIINAQYGLAELFFTTASILFGEDISIETLAYLRLALHLRPNFAPAQFLLAHVYEQQKAHERALSVYNSIRPGSVFYKRAQLRKALNYDALGQFNLAVSLLDKIARENQNDISPLVAKADLLSEKKRYAEAAENYSQAINRIGKTKNLHWSLYYARGICYERTDQWALAEQDFFAALKLEPDQPDVLNYLAYSWLVMGKNLSQAREFLQIAVAARPEDAHIIDSVGWAHYVSGDFSQSVLYLERAVDLSPADAAINDHLGDAYWRAGRPLEARYQWRHALRSKPDDALSKQLTLKLQEGLLPFFHQKKPGQKSGNASVSAPSIYKGAGAKSMIPVLQP